MVPENPELAILLITDAFSVDDLQLTPFFPKKTSGMTSLSEPTETNQHVLQLVSNNVQHVLKPQTKSSSIPWQTRKDLIFIRTARHLPLWLNMSRVPGKATTSHSRHPSPHIYYTCRTSNPIYFPKRGAPSMTMLVTDFQRVVLRWWMQ